MTVGVFCWSAGRRVVCGRSPLPQPPPARGGCFFGADVRGRFGGLPGAAGARGRGRGVQGLGHLGEGVSAERGGVVAGFVVRLGLLAAGLHAFEGAESALRLAHVAEGVGAALDDLGEGRRRVLGETHSRLDLLEGDDVESGELGFGEVGRLEGGDVDDGGLVAEGEVFGGVGQGGRESLAEGVDELVVDAGREPGGEGFGVGWGVGVGHGGGECSR